MTLSVHARRRDVDGDGAYVTPTPPHNDLAGFESWRHDVWGSPVVKRLGLRILPSLAEGDILASGARLSELDAEVKLLQRELNAVVDELVANGVHIVSKFVVVIGEGLREGLTDPHETVQFRLANIAEAIRLARAIPNGNGEVVIW